MSHFSKKNKLFIGLWSAIVFTAITPCSAPVLAVEQLLSQSQTRGVREGQVVISGTQGQYTGKMIVRSTPAIVWSVLTDYNNYENFLPDVEKSKIIQNNGNNKVFEQIKVIQAALFSRRSLIRIAVNESYPNQINFKMVSGEIKSLQGSWKIQPLARPSGNQPIQILITHQVSTDPGNVAWRGIFYSIYEDSLEETLQAIKTEIGRRTSAN